MQEELKPLQNRLLEMLLEFDAFCRENKLEYFLVGGTALGAWRHKGFIPWDDDVDLAMLRSDFERMESLMKDKQQNKLDTVLYSPVEAHLIPDAPIGYLYDGAREDIPFEKLAKLDIHPIDGVPKKSRARRKQNLLSKVYYLLVYGRPAKNKGRLMRLATQFILWCCRGSLRESCKRKLKKYLTRSDDRTSELVCSLFGLAGYEREVMPRAYLFPLQKLSFEGHLLPVPGQMEPYLERLYRNFMEMPPQEERVPKHDTYQYYL